MKYLKYKYNYLELTEIEKLTPTQLLREKNSMWEQHKVLLEEASHWRDSYNHLILELKARMDLLELELLATEEDRILQDSSKYDYLCRIH